MPIKQPAIEFLYKVFGSVTVLRDLGIQKNSRYVLGVCSCGVKKQFRLSDLKNGSSTNCGCERIRGLKRRSKHGLSNHPLYTVWSGIKDRCYRKGHEKYSRYGGRGIYVCDDWKVNFLSFYTWAVNNGYKKGMEVDRINNEGIYSPQNCRITTPKNNKRNKSNNRMITFLGQTKCLTEWAEQIGMNPDTLKDRIVKLKWPIDRALSTPVNAHLCL